MSFPIGSPWVPGKGPVASSQEFLFHTGEEGLPHFAVFRTVAPVVVEGRSRALPLAG